MDQYATLVLRLAATLLSYRKIAQSSLQQLYMVWKTLLHNGRLEEAIPGGKPSWTKLLIENPTLLCSKIRDEASELCQTKEASEGRDRMADVLYHSMVLLSIQDVRLEEVMATLWKRFSQFGMEEKNKRAIKAPTNQHKCMSIFLNTLPVHMIYYTK